MSASDAVLDFVANVLPQWVPQFGRWEDTPADARFAVLKPAGGAPAELLRRPGFTLSLVGLHPGDLNETKAAADAVVEAMRRSSGSLVFMQPSEPVYMPTADGRPVFELAVSAMTT